MNFKIILFKVRNYNIFQNISFYEIRNQILLNTKHLFYKSEEWYLGDIKNCLHKLFTHPYIYLPHIYSCFTLFICKLNKKVIRIQRWFYHSTNTNVEVQWYSNFISCAFKKIYVTSFSNNVWSLLKEQCKKCRKRT